MKDPGAGLEGQQVHVALPTKCGLEMKQGDLVPGVELCFPNHLWGRPLLPLPEYIMD